MKARIVRYSFIGVVAVLIILCGMKFSNMYKDYQKLQFNQEQIDTQVSVLMSIEHLNHAHLDALLNPPTNDMILEHLKKEMGHIPADYIEFLKQCNGLTLYHSGDYCLFDAQEILSFHFSNDNLLCRSAWKIGYWMGYDIVINVDDIEKEYLYAGDCCSTDEFICVGNILNFIEEIVKNGGDPYWTINENQYRDFSKK